MVSVIKLENDGLIVYITFPIAKQNVNIKKVSDFLCIRMSLTFISIKGNFRACK